MWLFFESFNRKAFVQAAGIDAEFLYKTTDYWYSEFERTIRWNDPDLGIDWPLGEEPVLSAKDRLGIRFADAETFA